MVSLLPYTQCCHFSIAPRDVGLWSNWNNPRGSVECPTGNVCIKYRTRWGWNLYSGTWDWYRWGYFFEFCPNHRFSCVAHNNNTFRLFRNGSHKVEPDQSPSNHHVWSTSEHSTIPNHAQHNEGQEETGTNDIARGYGQGIKTEFGRCFISEERSCSGLWAAFA